MGIRVFNTLSREKEELVTIEPNKVRMYVCGPTVYNKIHIGNARPAVIFDTVRKYLEYKGMEVDYVQNFTDIDDKIIKAANEENSTMSVISERYIKEFLTDMEGLNIKRATVHPRVTEEIPEIINMIETLVEKGYAYESEGHVYFSAESFSDYGKLSKKKLSELMSGARIQVAEEKRSPADFVLWKPAKENEPFWQSKWSEGRPGWHIECSAMAKKYLGDTIDIHAGGEDLIFPHHENEIAQSEAANGAAFARYWLHNGMINIDNAKMSKSLGNFFLLREVAEKFGYDTVRFFILSAHYRMPLNFSDDLLSAAKTSLSRITNAAEKAAEYTSSAVALMTDEEKSLLDSAKSFRKMFEESMDDDFNTANAVTALHGLAKFINLNVKEGTSSEFASFLLKEVNNLMNILGIEKKKEAAVDTEKIEALISERNEARKNKDFKKSDEIRDLLLEMGVEIKDTREGTRWNYNGI